MKILAIDGNSIISRAFYGIRPLTTAEGIHTNAVYGFLSTCFERPVKKRRRTPRSSAGI